MTLIKEVEDIFKNYTNLCSQLTKEISDYFLKEELTPCVSIINETQVELLFKVHYEDNNEMIRRCELFRKLLDDLCEDFSLQIIHSECGEYENMELPIEYRTFMYEKVLLVGVKNDG